MPVIMNPWWLVYGNDVRRRVIEFDEFNVERESAGLPDYYNSLGGGGCLAHPIVHKSLNGTHSQNSTTCLRNSELAGPAQEEEEDEWEMQNLN